MARKYYLLRKNDKQAWLRVPYWELVKLELLEIISEDSYFDNEHGYLFSQSDMLLYLQLNNLDIVTFIPNQTIERRADAIIHFKRFEEGLQHYHDFLSRYS